MSVIPIEQAMQHLRAEVEDQGYVELVLDAAEDSAAQFLNRRFYADADSLAAAVLDQSAGAEPMVITPAIRAACLLILGSLYATREAVVIGATATELPIGPRQLMMPYRVGLGV